MLNTKPLRSLRPLLLPALVLLGNAGAGCTDAPVFLAPGQAGSPAGVLEGTVTYAGPLPCTEGGYIVGAALLEVFDKRLLPPPEGLGTTAASLAVVAGEKLFAGVRDRLTFNEDGSRWCPDPGAKQVTVSAPWAAAPLPGGVFQVRGFYDYDGNFDPLITIYRIPTAGDIGGGAIDNAADVLLGAAPKYREIQLGVEKDGAYEIPDEGARIGGVTVTLALPLPLQPPIFYPKEVTYSSQKCDGTMPVPADPASTDPNEASMPADYTLPVFAASDPGGTQDSLIRVTFGAGVAPSEVETAAGSPFDLPVKDPAPLFTFSWQDVNGDGVLDILQGDHIPDSPLIPSLFPLAIFNKLEDAKDTIVAQASPAIILQGLTMYKDLVNTALSAPDLNAVDNKIVVGVRPAVLCLDPADFDSPALLIVTHKADCGGVHQILTDELGTKVALKRQFGHEVEVVEGCLPQGKYALNLIYGTGQAWTLPNEAGLCQATEPSKDGGKTCGDPTTDAHRPTIASQAWALTIREPDDGAYCDGARTKAIGDLVAKYPDKKKHIESCFPVAK